MKKLLFMSLLLPSFCFCQCKYDMNNIDPFTKVHKIEKKVEISGHYAGYLMVNFCKYDSSFFFRIHAIEDNPAVVGKYDAFIFLLNDDSIVKAYPDQIYSSDISTLSGTITLDATYYFENPADIKRLKIEKVKAVRIYYNNVYHEYKIKEKFSDALFKTVQCF